MSNPVQTKQQLAMRFSLWDARGKLRHSNKVIGVANVAEASARWCNIRDQRNLGASESPIVTVIDTVTGEAVAKVSYNGRVWDASGKEIACAS